MDWIDDIAVLIGVAAITRTDDIKKAFAGVRTKAETTAAKLEESHPDLKKSQAYRAPSSGAKADA
jgi:hypothetical protein